MTFPSPSAGPVGFASGPSGWSAVNQSAHHSRTFPAALHVPNSWRTGCFGRTSTTDDPGLRSQPVGTLHGEPPRRRDDSIEVVGVLLRTDEFPEDERPAEPLGVGGGPGVPDELDELRAGHLMAVRRTRRDRPPDAVPRRPPGTRPRRRSPSRSVRWGPRPSAPCRSSRATSRRRGFPQASFRFSPLATQHSGGA